MGQLTLVSQVKQPAWMPVFNRLEMPIDTELQLVRTAMLDTMHQLPVGARRPW